MISVATITQSSGFRQVAVPCSKASGKAGTTKYLLRKMSRLAMGPAPGQIPQS